MNNDRPKIRLFVEDSLFPGAKVLPAREQSHYLVNVMRLKAGDEVALFNGRDGEWTGVVDNPSRKEVLLHVAEHLRSQEKEPDLWLAFAPIKKTRIDFIAQKACELGVSKLLPVSTERTVAGRVKTERLVANAREAAEQSERLSVPDVADLQPLKKLLETWPMERKLLFCDENKTGPLILDALKSADRKPARHPWGILIGPEGGFSDKERAMVRALPCCVPASLGPRVLRADTAAFAALSLWQAAIGDW